MIFRISYTHGDGLFYVKKIHFYKIFFNAASFTRKNDKFMIQTQCIGS